MLQQTFLSLSYFSLLHFFNFRKLRTPGENNSARAFGTAFFRASTTTQFFPRSTQQQHAQVHYVSPRRCRPMQLHTFIAHDRRRKIIVGILLLTTCVCVCTALLMSTSGRYTEKMFSVLAGNPLLSPHTVRFPHTHTHTVR